MDWVTVLVSSLISVCLTLAAIHALAWLRCRNSSGNLMLSISAIGSAGLAACEFWMMQSRTTEEFGEALRWIHVPAFIVVCGLVGFIRLHLHGGIVWLAWVVCGIRFVSLILNFVFEPNLNYVEITHLRWVNFLGEQVAIGVGIPNPWMLVGQLSLFLLMVFGAQAAIQIGRRDGWGLSSLIAGSVAFFVLLGFVQVVLVLWGILDMPLTPGLFYFPILAAMGIGLSNELLRAASLTDELADREQQMELAATAANLGMWVRNLKDESVWATKECKALFDFPENQPLTADAMFSKIDQRDRESIETAVFTAIREKCLFHSEFRIPSGDGGGRWLRAVGKAEYDSAGQPVLLRGICADITAAKVADEEGRRLRDELAHASRVNLMGQLASALAHELNQPLAAILRNSEAAAILLKMPEPNLIDIGEILEDIAADSSRAGDVIDRMRSMLIRREKIYSPVDPAELVAGVVLLLRSDAAARDVALECEIGDPLPVIHGDEVQLRQVLMNLVINGMHAASESTAEKKVRIAVSGNADGDLEFHITDTGAGVPPEKAVRIFEPFFTTKTSGMGIGLALSRSIVEAHGGQLDLKKFTSCGATFCVRIPGDESARAIGGRHNLCG